MRFVKLPVLLPFIAVLLAHMIWGGNYVVVKLGLHEFPVMTLAFLRFGLAIILLTPFLFKFKIAHLRIKLEDLARLIAAGLFLTTINIAFFFEGLQHTEAISASVLSLMTPVLSLLAAWWFLKEKVYWINILGVVTSIVGAFIVIGLPLILTGSFIGSHLVGNTLLIFSCLSSVAGYVLLKDLLTKYEPIVINAIFFMVATASFLVPAYYDYQSNPTWIQNVSIIGFMSLLYITILSTITAYFLQSWAMKKIGVVHSNLFQYIEPAIAATLAVPILGERISYSFIVGTCAIILGVYWGTLGKHHHHHLHHKHIRS
jgi:drug/metabolite transporter (DMT)-like permease